MNRRLSGIIVDREDLEAIIENLKEVSHISAVTPYGDTLTARAEIALSRIQALLAEPEDEMVDRLTENLIGIDPDDRLEVTVRALLSTAKEAEHYWRRQRRQADGG